jgi:5-methylcytosine-specific restriction enzyme subunit McrC
MSSDVPADLLATVLIKGIEHLRRRGLNVGYRTEHEILAGVRGRINILETERRFLAQHGHAACHFDELTIDTPANRILKSTLKLLAKDPDLDASLRSELRALTRHFNVVSDVHVNSLSFTLVHLDRNSGFYRFLLNICELVQSAHLPGESGERYRFRDFLRDERKMAYVFQYFVFNFLRIERPDLNVGRENIYWKTDQLASPALSLLPQMQTDISVSAQGKKTIIDTKYYRKTLNEFYGAERLHSHNLYQIFTYLMNARRDGEEIEGILLYPLVKRSLKQRFSMCGVTVRVETLDLSQPWRMISTQLKGLMGY